MSSYIAGSLIGAGAVFLGSVATGVRETRARRAERNAARRTELKLAMREYLAALDAVTVELFDQPTPPQPTWLDRQLDKATERAGMHVVVFVLRRLLVRAAFGRRPEELTDRLAAAASHLRLVAPPQVEALMREVEQASQTYRPGDARWREGWMELRGKLRAQFRVALDDDKPGQSS